jgi:hypothetical protein
MFSDRWKEISRGKLCYFVDGPLATANVMHAQFYETIDLSEVAEDGSVKVHTYRFSEGSREGNLLYKYIGEKEFASNGSAI